jgi:ribosomal protein S18 acetylase RimI-like enzyme
MPIEIVVATNADYDQLAHLDHHVTPKVIAQKITNGEILVARRDGTVIGWLRYGYFWDSIPYMNMLVIQEPYRRQGIGTQLVTTWEQGMRTRGVPEVLTSTLANEYSQFLYRKLGYQDCGALLLPSEPLEIIMRKVL